MRRSERAAVRVDEDGTRIRIGSDWRPQAVQVGAGLKDERHGVARVQDKANFARVGSPPVVDREWTN